MAKAQSLHPRRSPRKTDIKQRHQDKAVTSILRELLNEFASKHERSRILKRAARGCRRESFWGAWEGLRAIPPLPKSDRCCPAR